MTLTPQDIEHQVFRERRRGYDPEEVDRFLDDVSATIAELMRERDIAKQRLDELERSSDESRESEGLLRRTLIAAERTAEQTVAEAQEEADRLREEARRESTELRESAEQETAELRRSTEQETAELRRSAEQEAAELRRSAEQEAAELRRSVEEEVAQERQLAKVGADRVRRAIAELQNFREEYRERVQSVIAEQLAALDRVGDLPDLDPALDRLAHSVTPDGEGSEHSHQPG